MIKNYKISVDSKEKTKKLQMDVVNIRKQISNLKLEIQDLNTENLYSISMSWLNPEVMKKVQLRKRRLLLNKRQVFNLLRRINSREEHIKDILLQEVQEKLEEAREQISEDEYTLEFKKIQDLRELLEIEYTIKDIEIEFAIAAIQMEITEGEKHLGIFPELMLKAERMNTATKMEEAKNSKRFIIKESEVKNKLLNNIKFDNYLEQFLDKHLIPKMEVNQNKEETRKEETQLMLPEVSKYKKIISFIKRIFKKNKDTKNIEVIYSDN